MKKLRCNCCGFDLQKGSLKYVIEIKSFADLDGYLEEFDGDIEEGINELLEAVELMDPGTVEEHVSMEHIYILCKDCRERFTSDPFQTGGTILCEEAKGTIH